MQHQENHLTDQELLLAADGELSDRAAARVERHLAACWACRARKQEMEGAVGDFIRVYRDTLDAQLPRADGPRALLKAHLAQQEQKAGSFWLQPATWAMVVIAAALALFAYLEVRRPTSQRARAVTVTVPDRSLTPGAAVLVSRQEVCSESNTKNKAVPATLRQRVFEAYGIHTAELRAYEVDYLITPALGGADDIHNLWPESYGSTAWNAGVKDALEDHLREMVCAGDLDLSTAQHEIAANWIDAYKKYFHTDRPLTGVSRDRFGRYPEPSLSR